MVLTSLTWDPHAPAPIREESRGSEWAQPGCLCPTGPDLLAWFLPDPNTTDLPTDHRTLTLSGYDLWTEFPGWLSTCLSTMNLPDDIEPGCRFCAFPPPSQPSMLPDHNLLVYSACTLNWIDQSSESVCCRQAMASPLFLHMIFMEKLCLKIL